MSIDPKTEINDKRLSDDFKSVSFSGFKKTEVKHQLEENMRRGRVEPACYWCAELICAGHFLDIWEIIFHFMAKHIHLGNPAMPIYVEMRYRLFRNIVGQSIFLTELYTRNHGPIRQLFAEVICNLTLSNRKPSFETVKIKRAEEFDVTQMSEKLKATSVEYAATILKPKDPPELMIAVNEFCYNIHHTVNSMVNACYWIEWMLDFDVICNKQKLRTLCVPRLYVDNPKLRMDIVWVIWDALLHECEQRKDAMSEFRKKITRALLNLFLVKYTNATGRKRKYLLYFAVELLTEPIHHSVDLVANKDVLSTVVKHIDHVYRQIKKNEQVPNTDYLFDGLERENNFQAMVARMDALESLESLS
jgi:hypothetical protein